MSFLLIKPVKNQLYSYLNWRKIKEKCIQPKKRKCSWPNATLETVNEQQNKEGIAKIERDGILDKSSAVLDQIV